MQLSDEQRQHIEQRIKALLIERDRFKLEAAHKQGMYDGAIAALRDTLQESVVAASEQNAVA